MHVVHILPELKQGGVEQVVVDLNRETVKQGHFSTVISAGGPLAEKIEADGGRHLQMDVCSKNPFSVPARVSLLRSMLRSLSPDVLHLHSRVPAWLAHFANRPLRIPIITTVHGFNSVSKYSEIMTRGTRVICVSNPVKTFIRQQYKTPEAKIRVIHCGLNPERFDPAQISTETVNELRNRFHLAGKFVACSIGRITELKDYETFIRAIGIALPRNPDLRGLIVGHVRADKQAYHQELASLIRKLGLQEQIHIVTDVSDMPAVYTLADVVVSCSKKPESFGLTLIEALAMNTPVIATRHGGPLDIIREGRNGCFFNPGDADALSVLLAGPLSIDRTLLRSDVLERFGMDRMIESTLRVYREVVAEGE